MISSRKHRYEMGHRVVNFAIYGVTWFLCDDFLALLPALKNTTPLTICARDLSRTVTFTLECDMKTFVLRPCATFTGDNSAWHTREPKQSGT